MDIVKTFKKDLKTAVFSQDLLFIQDTINEAEPEFLYWETRIGVFFSRLDRWGPPAPRPLSAGPRSLEIRLAQPPGSPRWDDGEAVTSNAGY